MSHQQESGSKAPGATSSSSSTTAAAGGGGTTAAAASSEGPAVQRIDPLIRDLEGGILVPNAPRPVGPLLKASSQPASQQSLSSTAPTSSSSSSTGAAGSGISLGTGVGHSGVSARLAGVGPSPLASPSSSTSSLLPGGGPTTGLASAAARVRQPLLNHMTDATGSTSAGPARRPFIPEAIPPAIRRLSTAGTNNNSASAASSRLKGTPARSTRYSLPVRSDKPVRTSKTTGKHIVLPSESQLAPLPHEDDEDSEEGSGDDDEDEDDEDEEESGDEHDSGEGTTVPGTSPTEDRSASLSQAVGAKQAPETPRTAAPEQPDQQRSRAAAALRVSQRRTGPTPAPRITPERSTTLSTMGHARPLIKQMPNELPPSALKRAPAPPGSAPVKQPARLMPAHARAPPRYPKSSGPAFHTFERLLPAARVSTPLPRVTSFAIGTALHLPTLIGFLRREHGVKPRLYDECVYVVYVKPLLPGFGRANVRSAPEPKTGSPGGESRREREMEAREESGYVGSYFAARKEEREEIDPQGYIEEGEGRENDSDAARRRAREQRARDGNETDGGMERSFDTETETETEREKRVGGGGGHGGDVVRSDVEETEGEDDSALHRLLSAAPDGLLVDIGEITPDPSKPATPAVETPILVSEPESGAETPRLRPSEPSDISADLDVKTPIAEILADPILMDGSALLDSPEAPLPLTLAPAEDGPPNGGKTSSGATKTKKAGKSGARARKGRGARKATMPNMCSHNHDASANMLTTREILEALQLAELIILPYGVLVMYNFSAIEERQVIEDIVSSGGVRGPLSPEDEETEAFHFCYDPTVPAPRIFNDFFTFRAPNHLLKLSLAHAIAQSTKLSVFEESMQRTLELTSHIPKELANTGELKLKRREALRLTGRLFKLRVDVNLTSNVASVPELFWSHATLKALYDPIRDYLEIDQRVENLNERLAVANDLLEIIHEDIANKAMSNITLIIIILILVACIVACGEISARLILHNRGASAVSKLARAAARTGGGGLWGAGAGFDAAAVGQEPFRLVTRSATGWATSA
ncbi:Sad1-interacting factor 3 [Tilletia horrida]|nr:Sad1-interacting factor 3 [Tilletia horrida]